MRYQWLCQEDWGVSMAVPGGLGGINGCARRTGGYQWLCQEDWGVSMAVLGGLGGINGCARRTGGASMAVLSVKQRHTSASKTPRASETNDGWG